MTQKKITKEQLLVAAKDIAIELAILIGKKIIEVSEQAKK